MAFTDINLGTAGTQTGDTIREAMASINTNFDDAQSQLDGKSGTSHVHDSRYYTISALDTALAGKAPTSHSHPISDITGLQSALDGKSSTSHVHDDRYYKYQATTVHNDLAVGWYTIATNLGNRATARFLVRDTDSSDHQSVVFYASHHYGNGNEITVVHNGLYSGNPLRYIRIREGSTYDGAMLQIYIDDATNQVQAWVTDEFQSSGWVVKDWIISTTNPGGLGNYSALTNTGAQIDLNNDLGGAIMTTGHIFSGGQTTQYKQATESWVSSNTRSSSWVPTWSEVSGKPSTFTPATHSHPTSDITSGTFADARISQSSVTQHQGALSIAWSQITGEPSTYAPSAHSLGSHSDVTITSIASGEILKWSGTAWINQTLAEAGISATSHTHSYLPLSGGTLTGALIGTTIRLSGNLVRDGDTNTGIQLTNDRVQIVAGGVTFYDTANGPPLFSSTGKVTDLDFDDATGELFVKFGGDGSWWTSDKIFTKV